MSKTDLEYCWMLHEIAKALGSAGNLPAVLNLIAKSAADGLGLKACTIRLLDKRGEMLELAAAYGLSDAYLRKGPVEFKRSLYDERALRGEPIIVEDIGRDERLQYPEEAIREGLRSMAAVPLIARDKYLGSLRVFSSEPHKFSKSELTFLTALANLGAIAIENARMGESLRRRMENMSTLLEISKRITSSLKPEEVFERVARAAASGLGAQGSALWLLEEGGGELELAFAYGFGDRGLAKSMPISKELPELLSGEVVAIFDASSDPRAKDLEEVRAWGMRGILAAPLFIKGRVAGVLKVYSKEPRDFDENDREFLSILANLGGIAIQNSKLYKMAMANWRELTREIWSKIDAWGAPG
ncbi:MAG: GAF domain-containing protein [Candidatus Bathyarchaeia archaeon]